MLPKFAVPAAPFALPLRQFLRTAASLGVQGVQFDARNDLRPNELSDTGRRQFLHEVDEHGLQVASLVFPTRRTYYDQEELDARVAACRLAMQFAWQLKSKVVTTRVGRIPEATTPEYRILVDVLNDLAAHGNHVGVTLALTPTRDTSSTLLALFQEVTAGPLAVNFDPVPFILSGEKPEKAFRALHDRIAHLTVRDALRDIDAAGLETAVGRGEVPWEEILALGEEAGYRGWWTLDRTQGDDRTGDIARAAAYLRTIALGG